MIGLVVVSQSSELTANAVELAREMVPAGVRPPVTVAAGLTGTALVTDGVTITEAITAADSPDGVLVLVDIGTAILSAEMAVHLLSPELAARTRILPAPPFDGLVAAFAAAGSGAGLDEVINQAVGQLTSKRAQVVIGDALLDPLVVEAGDPALSLCWTVRNAHGVHVRPAAVLVDWLHGLDAEVTLRNVTTGRGPAVVSGLMSVLTLGLRQGDQMECVVTGRQAELALERLRVLVERDFDERGPDREPAPTRKSSVEFGDAPPARQVKAGRKASDIERQFEPSKELELYGVRRVPPRSGTQIAFGVARRYVVDPDCAGYCPGDKATEARRLKEAMEGVANCLDDMQTQADKVTYTVQKLLLDAARQTMLDDAAQNATAVHAVRSCFNNAARQMAGVDDRYLRARAADLREVARLLLRALMELPLTAEEATGILIVDELDPVTAATVEMTLCQGVISIFGTTTGLAARVAARRGLALLAGRPEAAEIPEGVLVAFDPAHGQLLVDPTPEQLTDLNRNQADRQALEEEAVRLARHPAKTKSGVRVLVEANVSSIADAMEAAEAGAEGSGMVRTEVLFSQWQHAPSADDQAELFVRIGRAFYRDTITIRTWAPSSDKPLAFIAQEDEPNPLLGNRGIRAMQRLPELFDEQLKAALLASQKVNVRVLLPMITQPFEMVWARARLAAVQAKVDGGHVDVGMMVAVPSTAIRAADFVSLADFVSISTDDLLQYTLAVDRGNPTISNVAMGDYSAVNDLIDMTTAAFKGHPVAVCGDLASHSEAIPRLISTGVTELCVRPQLVGLTKQIVRGAD